MTEIGGIFFLVFQADFVRNEFDGLAFEIRQRLFFVLKKESLWNVSQFADFFAVLNGFSNFHHGEFPHAVDTDVGLAVDQNAGLQAVVPVVVVRYASQRSLDAAHDDGHVGIEFL